MKQLIDELKHRQEDAQNSALISNQSLSEASYHEGCEDTYGEVLHLLEKHLTDKAIVSQDFVNAVAHIGIDFGYGNYELESKYIQEAQAMLSANNLDNE